MLVGDIVQTLGLYAKFEILYIGILNYGSYCRDKMLDI